MLILVFTAAVVLFFNMYAKNSPKKIAEKVHLLLETSIKDMNYNDIYDILGDFFDRENYEEIITKYYDSVWGFDTAEDAYISLCAYYDSAMIHLKKYDEFEKSLNGKADYSYDKYNRYFISLWTLGIVYSNENDSFDWKSIYQIIENSKFKDVAFEKSKLEFLYHFSEYFDMKISDNLSSVKDSENYADSRSQYVLTFLYIKNYDDFEKMFLKEYVNDPFTGSDILVLISSKNIINSDQLNILNKSLEKLKEEYRIKRSDSYPLKKLLIESLQNQITSVKSS